MDQIKEILSKFIQSSELLDLFVNSKTLPLWNRSLTHKSINFVNNYERYEFIGDAALGYAFNLYLRDYQDVHDYAIMNGLLNFYMSKRYQPQMTKKLGLDKLININFEIKLTDDILEDVLESFFGVFTYLCRNLKRKYSIIEDPIFYIIEFFKYYFEGTIDISKGNLINKNIFDEFYYFMSGESPQAKNYWYYNSKTLSFYYNPEYLNRMKLYSPELSNEIRSILNKKGLTSESEYIDLVVSKLQDLGYTLKWLADEKSKITFDSEIKALAKERGLTRYILQRNEKKSYDLLAQSVDPKSRKSVSKTLHSFDDSDSFLSIKEQARKIILDSE